MSSTSEIIKLITQIRARNVFALVGSGGSGTGEPAIPLGVNAQYWRGDKSWQTLNKAAVGLSNVDNVADIDKGVSTAAAGALAGKADSSHGHAQGDVTGLAASLAAKADATALAGKLDTSHAGTGGTAHAAVVAGGAAGFMSGTDKTKLDGIAAGATANSADATLLNRANHTGTQTLGTISGLAAGVSAFLATPNSANLATMLTDETGSGAAVFANGPLLNGATFGTTSGVLAGTNAQGQGPLPQDFNIITSAVNNPSGVTLPVPAAGRWVVVKNRAANPVNVYPAAGGAIDSLPANQPVQLVSGGIIEFFSETATVWSSTQGSSNPVLLGTTYMQQGAPTSLAAAATLTIAQILTGIIQYTGAAATLTLPTGALIDAGILASLPVDRAFDFVVINTGSGTATLATATGLTLVGSVAVAIATSARFRVRKTAASTFTVYRVG